MNKTELLQVRVSPDLKAKIKAAADADNRSVSGYVENLIKQAIDKREG
ncbi:MAG: DUF1778 domain-containing protein [Candidatus Enterenecus sp.]